MPLGWRVFRPALFRSFLCSGRSSDRPAQVCERASERQPPSWRGLGLCLCSAGLHASAFVGPASRGGPPWRAAIHRRSHGLNCLSQIRDTTPPASPPRTPPSQSPLPLLRPAQPSHRHIERGHLPPHTLASQSPASLVLESVQVCLQLPP